MSIWQSLDPVLGVRLVLVALAVFLCLLAALTWERRHEAPEATSFALLVLGGALYFDGHLGDRLTDVTVLVDDLRRRGPLFEHVLSALRGRDVNIYQARGS